MKDSSRREVRLGDLLTTSPFTGARQGVDGGAAGIPFVSTSLVTSGDGAIVRAPAERTARASGRRLAARGDILLVTRGVERRSTVPASVVEVDEPLAFAESLVLLRVDPREADPHYLRLYLTSAAGATALSAIATGTTISYLRPEALVGLTLMLPPIDEQVRAAAKVQALSAGLARLDATVEAYRALVAATTEGMVAGVLRVRPDGGGRHRQGGGRR